MQIISTVIIKAVHTMLFQIPQETFLVIKTPAQDW